MSLQSWDVSHPCPAQVKAHVQRASDEKVRAHQLADQAYELAKAVTNDPGVKHYAEQTRLMTKAHAREASECARQAGKLQGRKRVRNSQLQRLISRSFSTRFG